MRRIIVVLMLSTLAFLGCSRAVKPQDYGIKKGTDYLKIVVLKPQEEKNVNAEFVGSDNYVLNSLVFQGNNKKKFLRQNDVLSFITRDYEPMAPFLGDSVYKMNFNLIESDSGNKVKYTLAYIDSSAQAGPDDNSTFYKDSKEILGAIVGSIKYFTTFEYYSTYKQDAIYANFQRAAQLQNESVRDPVTGKIIESYFQLEIEPQKKADIYLSLYPYREGTKIVVGTYVPAVEKDGIIDFVKLAGDVSNRIDKIVND